MVIVTDLDLYIDQNLKNMLDLLVHRKKKKWDNVLIIDGKERSGKSTLAKTIAYYYGEQIGQKFSLKNTFFDIQEMMEFARNEYGKLIVWDEAALGGLAIDWRNKIQQDLSVMLMTTGDHNHFYIMIVPNFFRLKDYLAIDRSIGLLHVYSPDMITRGYFQCLNESQKVWAYNNFKKSQTYGRNCSFRGRFTEKHTDRIYPEDEYLEKKHKAIDKYLNQSTTKTEARFQAVKHNIATMLPLNLAMKVGNVSQSVIFDWKKLKIA